MNTPNKPATHTPWRYSTIALHNPERLALLAGEQEIARIEFTGICSESEEQARAELIAQAPTLAAENAKLREALEAIQARIDGVWDCPALVKFGPLSTEQTDIQRILQSLSRQP